MSRNKGKKEVEAIVAAMGVFMSFITILVELVKKLGGSAEDIYFLATPSGKEKMAAIASIIVGKAKDVVEKVEKIIYAIIVDYGTSLEDMVKLGKYDYANDNITTKNFPTKRSGKVDIVIELVPFGRNISSEDAIKELDKMGLRAAEPHELLAFGAKYPDVQREFPIVALGSVWRGWDDDRSVVCLIRGDTKRSAVLRGFVGDWVGYWRFAAVRK